MKKIIIILSIIVSIVLWNQSRLPEKTIRFRIIANSNQEIDQQTKKEIVKSLSKELSYQSRSIEEEREYIKKQIPTITKTLNQILEDDYTIQYGENYFPEKEYQNKTYPEGLYESLVITLGEGKGDNFWCILFPPLCMIDEDENIEYDSILKQVWNKIF